jgi:ribosome-associated protein
MMTQDQNPEAGAPTPEIPDGSRGFALAERVAWFAMERKGEDVVILDLRGLSDVCDFFVLATGQADVQVRAIARAVRDGLAAAGEDPVGSEGESDGRWVLLDYVDVIVHVLKPEVRDYYQLERLWADARTLIVDAALLQSEGFAARHPDLAPPPGAAPAE